MPRTPKNKKSPSPLGESPNLPESILRALAKTPNGAAAVASLVTRTKPKAAKRQRHATLELTIPPDFELTPEFSRAFNMMENTDEHLFITGRAGTGKSTLLQYFRSQTKKNFVVLAPTGAAAVNVGGSTIHSFFRFPPHVINRKDIHDVPEKRRLFTVLDTVIIDEVSMVRADLMQAVDLALRLNRGRLDEPFGGVQMILIGDLYQLPPVVETGARDAFGDDFTSSYFFGAPIFSEMDITRIDLQRIFRQTDPEFIRILNQVRDARVTDRDLNLLNQCCAIDFSNDYSDDFSDVAIILTATNARAAQINAARLGMLPGDEVAFESTVSGRFDERAFPADQRLILKPGAQVMMLRNDTENRWVNGSLGTVHSVSRELIEVSIGGEIFPVERANWERVDYQFDPSAHAIVPIVVGTFRQYPMRLAWAITIHKSQGKTFDKVVIDFGRGAFAHGQAYVALSRCRTMQGIRLTTPIRMRDILLDREVSDFLLSANSPPEI